MSQLVFVSISGGSVTLNGPNTAGTYNLAIPAADGTLLYSDLTGTITFNNVIISGQLTLSGNGALAIPVGNTVQRPSPVAGDIRYNTDGGGLYEVYLPAISQWQKIVTVTEGQYTITYLIVSGGGGGGSGTPAQYGGGGGAGGLLSGTFTAIPSTLFTVTIGAGGAGGTNGTGSSVTGVATANGGGCGADSESNPSNAGSGGSGGGGAVQSGSLNGYGGNGINGQGYDGGDNFADYYGGAGGGGAGAVGMNARNGFGGDGGVGLVSTITGVVTYFAGGGAGGSSSSGGTGGGGSSANPGSANTGGGGGSQRSGGSGVVIFSVPTTNYTGTVTGLPTITTSGSNTIIKFINSGSYTA